MLKNLKLFLSVGLFLFGVSSVFANTITISVHGKSNSNHCGTSTTDVNSYWGANANVVSGTKYFVGYDGTTEPRTYGTCRAQTNLTTDKALIVFTARSSFNHNNTAGVTVAHVPGYKDLVGASAILPGEDDFAVAYHSSCGYSQAGGLSVCQSSVTQTEGVWPFQSQKTYTQYSGHVRAPSVPAAGLYENHSELCNDGWR